ncbi:type I 3-dehydroquinate dehydratase [Halobacterium yunchengense]|uniref:type I 3-dehydroquinate dehydratase n=1 Tax=Halobacterium yunchengense TaxID=3108497 RepID=UPI00300832E8
MDFEEFVLAAVVTDLDDEPAAREHADAVEFRMDLAADPLGALDDYDGDLPVVATNRAAWEGGEADGDDRIDALAEAARTDAVAAIDVELAALVGDGNGDTAGPSGEGAEALAAARASDTATIVSSHDFEATPSMGEMAETLAEACSLGDVGKLAVTAHDHGDALDVLRVTHEFTAVDAHVATMAMGEVGRHTRAVAPLYGSRVGYAPVDPERATAPGQYDAATLRALVDDLV